MKKSQPLPQQGSASSECTTSYKQTVICTTFVETDPNNFRELVQKLTGVSDGEQLSVMEKDSPGAGIKSEGNCSAFTKGGIEVGPQKSAFKLHHRRQFQKRLEIRPGHCNHASILSGGKKNLVNPSPITPLGPTDPFNTSPSYCYSSTPTSCNPSSYLEEGEKEFCFLDSAISVKREPELLPLFPLHSPTQPNPLLH